MNSRGAMDVLAERRRQIKVEGWTAKHDDEANDPDALALAGAAYAIPEDRRSVEPDGWSSTLREFLWPWVEKWWKPKNRRRDLVRAAALIIAEIDRLDREAVRAGG